MATKNDDAIDHGWRTIPRRHSQSTITSPALMSDQDLLDATVRVAGVERRTTAELLALLAELDTRKLYLGEGYSSLFTYCTQRLHLSESAAYVRITAPGGGRFPILLARLAERDVTLTSISLLATHLTDDNHESLLDAARHASRRDVERLVASLHAQPDIPAIVRRVPGRSEPPTGDSIAADVHERDAGRVAERFRRHSVAAAGTWPAGGRSARSATAGASPQPASPGGRRFASRDVWTLRPSALVRPLPFGAFLNLRIAPNAPPLGRARAGGSSEHLCASDGGVPVGSHNDADDHRAQDQVHGRRDTRNRRPHDRRRHRQRRPTQDDDGAGGGECPPLTSETGCAPGRDVKHAPGYLRCRPRGRSASGSCRGGHWRDRAARPRTGDRARRRQGSIRAGKQAESSRAPG